MLHECDIKILRSRRLIYRQIDELLSSASAKRQLMYFPCDKEVALVLIKLTSQNSSITSSQLHLSSDRKKNNQSKLQVSPPGTDIAEGISTYADYCTKHFSIIFRL